MRLLQVPTMAVTAGLSSDYSFGKTSHQLRPKFLDSMYCCANHKLSYDSRNLELGIHSMPYCSTHRRNTNKIPLYSMIPVFRTPSMLLLVLQVVLDTENVVSDERDVCHVCEISLTQDVSFCKTIPRLPVVHIIYNWIHVA